jgi:hypothetical protein
MTLITPMPGPACKSRVKSAINATLKSTILVVGITTWQPHPIQSNWSHLCTDSALRIDFPHFEQIPLPVPVLEHVVHTPTPPIKGTGSDAIWRNITYLRHHWQIQRQFPNRDLHIVSHFSIQLPVCCSVFIPFPQGRLENLLLFRKIYLAAFVLVSLSFFLICKLHDIFPAFLLQFLKYFFLSLQQTRWRIRWSRGITRHLLEIVSTCRYIRLENTCNKLDEFYPPSHSLP